MDFSSFPIACIKEIIKIISKYKNQNLEAIKREICSKMEKENNNFLNIYARAFKSIQSQKELHDVIVEILKGKIQSKLNLGIEREKQITDPITKQVMKNPVRLKKNGEIFDQETLDEHFKRSNTCPKTNIVLKENEKKYIVLSKKKKVIEQWRQKYFKQVQRLSIIFFSYVIHNENEELREVLEKLYDRANLYIPPLSFFDLQEEFYRKYGKTEKLSEMYLFKLKHFISNGKDIGAVYEYFKKYVDKQLDEKKMFDEKLKILESIHMMKGEHLQLSLDYSSILYQQREKVKADSIIFPLIKSGNFEAINLYLDNNTKNVLETFEKEKLLDNFKNKNERVLILKRLSQKYPNNKIVENEVMKLLENFEAGESASKIFNDFGLDVQSLALSLVKKVKSIRSISDGVKKENVVIQRDLKDLRLLNQNLEQKIKKMEDKVESMQKMFVKIQGIQKNIETIPVSPVVDKKKSLEIEKVDKIKNNKDPNFEEEIGYDMDDMSKRWGIGKGNKPMKSVHILNYSDPLPEEEEILPGGSFVLVNNLKIDTTLEDIRDFCYENGRDLPVDIVHEQKEGMAIIEFRGGSPTMSKILEKGEVKIREENIIVESVDENLRDLAAVAFLNKMNRIRVFPVAKEVRIGEIYAQFESIGVVEDVRVDYDNKDCVVLFRKVKYALNAVIQMQGTSFPSDKNEELTIVFFHEKGDEYIKTLIKEYREKEALSKPDLLKKNLKINEDYLKRREERTGIPSIKPDFDNYDSGFGTDESEEDTQNNENNDEYDDDDIFEDVKDDFKETEFQETPTEVIKPEFRKFEEKKLEEKKIVEIGVLDEALEELKDFGSSDDDSELEDLLNDNEGIIQSKEEKKNVFLKKKVTPDLLLKNKKKKEKKITRVRYGNKVRLENLPNSVYTQWITDFFRSSQIQVKRNIDIRNGCAIVELYKIDEAIVEKLRKLDNSGYLMNQSEVDIYFVPEGGKKDESMFSVMVGGFSEGLTDKKYVKKIFHDCGIIFKITFSRNIVVISFDSEAAVKKAIAKHNSKLDIGKTIHVQRMTI